MKWSAVSMCTAALTVLAACGSDVGDPKREPPPVAPQAAPVASAEPPVAVDAGSPVRAGSPGEATNQILSAKSAACLVCAQTNCGALVGGCAAVEGEAAQGPAAGKRRSDLCVDTLACVIPSKCGYPSGAACYCGKAEGAGCFTPGAADGPCKGVLERALETTSPTDVATWYGDDKRGGGRAMLLVACLNDNGCDSCF